MLTKCTVAVVAASLCACAFQGGHERITRPMVSERTSPLEEMAPVARDGHRGLGVLRKPLGAGPFPAVVMIHGGPTTFPPGRLQDMALNNAQALRFLAAGYLVAVITYRSRDRDPQSTVPLDDALAAVDYLRRLRYVDGGSIVIFGCSGGGDLALEMAAASADVAAIVAEEPASVIFTGVFNTKLPKKGERYTARDADPIGRNPTKYYTPEYQKLTREKVARIQSPILILQGGQHWLNRFNAEILIPELRSGRKTVEVKIYPGEPHCFAMMGRGSPRPALEAFKDADAFYRRHLRKMPRAIALRLVRDVPL
jgi:dipeptidyl aminopeptidase/acylaminoacyl peptidase